MRNFWCQIVIKSPQKLLRAYGFSTELSCIVFIKVYGGYEKFKNSLLHCTFLGTFLEGLSLLDEQS